MAKKNLCADCAHYAACKSWCMNFADTYNPEDIISCCDDYVRHIDTVYTVENSELFERRKNMFGRLGGVLMSENIGTLTKYIIEMWKYLADEHGEILCVDVDESEGDG